MTTILEERWQCVEDAEALWVRRSFTCAGCGRRDVGGWSAYLETSLPGDWARLSIGSTLKDYCGPCARGRQTSQ